LDGVSIVEIATIEPFADVSLALGTMAALWRFRSRWDIVHAHQPHLQTVCTAIVARILGRPQVTTFHLSPPRPRGVRGFLARVWTRLSLAVATERVFVSSSTQATFGTSGRIIYNGVDTTSKDRRSASREEVRGELNLGGAFVLAFAGRVTRSKGIYELLEALGQLSARERGADPRLLTFGPIPEPERAEYAARKQALGISNRVRDFGFRRDWRMYLPACDVFVLPSHYEGLPLSLLEAMAEGVPVVASRVGGIPEIVEHGKNGYLIEPEDAKGLGRTLADLWSHPEWRGAVGNAAARIVAERFSSASMGDAYLQVYGELLGRPASGALH
jgi:glycosyltransferase involved in cell wall biosynthesis